MSNVSTNKRGFPNPLAWIGAAALGFFAAAVLLHIAPANVVFTGFISSALWLVFGGLFIAAGVTPNASAASSTVAELLSDSITSISGAWVRKKARTDSTLICSFRFCEGFGTVRSRPPTAAGRTARGCDDPEARPVRPSACAAP